MEEQGSCYGLDGKFSILNGDLISVISVKSNKISYYLVHEFFDDDYILIDLLEKNQISTMEKFLTEIQSKKEIIEYLEYITKSDEVLIQYLGNIYDIDTFDYICRILDCQVENLQNFIRDVVLKIDYLYNQTNKILGISLKSGNVLNIFDNDGHLISEEKILKISKSEFVCIPKNKKLSDINIEDEKISEDELLDYLYTLIAFENVTFEIKKTIPLPIHSANKKILIV